MRAEQKHTLIAMLIDTDVSIYYTCYNKLIVVLTAVDRNYISNLILHKSMNS